MKREAGFSERDCLDYDPFEGDFGSPGDRILADRMVKAAKPHDKACHMCGGAIAKDERHRVRTEIVDDELQSYRWCALCCAAMAKSWTDNGADVDARTSLHPAWAHLSSEPSQ